MALIEIHNLFHHFANGAAGLCEINLCIDAGEFVIIAGANGSGKSTLLRHLNGLLHPSQGAVYLDGHKVTRGWRQARQMVGFVFQDADCQIVGETVRDDVAFGPRNLSLPILQIQQRTDQALQAVGLAHLADQHPQTLSGGEKRRLAIAGALAMRPRILVCDEPFANLDYPGLRQVLTHITRLHHQGITIVLASHDIENVIAHASRLVIMQAGRIVRDDHPQHLMGELETYSVRQPCTVRWGQPLQSWLN